MKLSNFHHIVALDVANIGSGMTCWNKVDPHAKRLTKLSACLVGVAEPRVSLHTLAADSFFREGHLAGQIHIQRSHGGLNAGDWHLVVLVGGVLSRCTEAMVYLVSNDLKLQRAMAQFYTEERLVAVTGCFDDESWAHRLLLSIECQHRL